MRLIFKSYMQANKPFRRQMNKIHVQFSTMSCQLPKEYQRKVHRIDPHFLPLLKNYSKISLNILKHLISNESYRLDHVCFREKLYPLLTLFQIQVRDHLNVNHSLKEVLQSNERLSITIER